MRKNKTKNKKTSKSYKKPPNIKKFSPPVVPPKKTSAGKKLYDSEEVFRALADASPVGVYLIQDGVIKYVNRKSAQILGSTIQEMEEKLQLKDFIPGKDIPRAEKTIRKRLTGKLNATYYDGKFIRKDKKLIDVEVYGSRIQYHGKPAIVGSIIDITERNRAVREKERMQAQVFQLQKMEAIGIMTGGVAHDLNNILTVIQGHAELGILRLNENKSLRHDLDEILDASIKGTNLTHQLLLFGRKSPVELAPLNINATTNDLLKMLKRLIGEHIKIVLELAGDLWMIMADTGNIQQVIMNLVINASHAIVKDGTITIRTENSFIDEETSITIPESHPGNYVCLTVSDTGNGIETEIIDRIFEPFFTTKDKEKGTGLGLSVVYGIAKQHNGWINVYSKLGEGTTFKVYFPAVLQIHETTGREKLSFKDLNGNGERILLVEDEESMLNFVKIVLSENGYQVFPASSAQEAISIFKRENQKFDLIFSDVVLPDSNGIRLIEELLLYKPGFLCLLTSGYTDEKSQWAFIKEKGYPFIQKPYTLYDLFRTIKDMITARAQII
jgi:PAS domain S-box-containing protein